MMTTARQEIPWSWRRKALVSIGNTAGNIRNNPLGKARIALAGESVVLVRRAV